MLKAQGRIVNIVVGKWGVTSGVLLFYLHGDCIVRKHCAQMVDVDTAVRRTIYASRFQIYTSYTAYTRWTVNKSKGLEVPAGICLVLLWTDWMHKMMSGRRRKVQVPACCNSTGSLTMYSNSNCNRVLVCMIWFCSFRQCNLSRSGLSSSLCQRTVCCSIWTCRPLHFGHNHHESLGRQCTSWTNSDCFQV